MEPNYTYMRADLYIEEDGSVLIVLPKTAKRGGKRECTSKHLQGVIRPTRPTRVYTNKFNQAVLVYKRED